MLYYVRKKSGHTNDGIKILLLLMPTRFSRGLPSSLNYYYILTKRISSKLKSPIKCNWERNPKS